MISAFASLKAEKPSKIIVAVPASPGAVAEQLRLEGAEVIVLTGEANYLGAVGAYYQHFPQVTDEEVIALLSATVA